MSRTSYAILVTLFLGIVITTGAVAMLTSAVVNRTFD